MESGSKVKLDMLVKEILLRRNFVILFFSTIIVVLVLIGSIWPNQYSSSTSIFVEEDNILGPLMAGAAVQTLVIDRAAIAREIIFGRKIMYQLLEKEGLTEELADPVIQERIINDIKSRLHITNVRNNLIKIEYKDQDPDRVYSVTNNVAKLLIEESLADKARQSTEAFQFIDKQAMEYKEKLQNAEMELKKFRSENLDAQPGMAEGIGRMNTDLQSRRELIIQELKEAMIRKASLESQLTGEAQATNAFSRSEQYKTRIAELQSRLDTLRLSYHETYPDIVHLTTQIQDLRNAVIVSEKDARNDAASNGLDERVHSNPVYQQLQRDLYDTNTNIQTLNARLEHTDTVLREHMRKAHRVSEFAAQLQELTRDYDINNASYSDLMTRREQARVSMNLDIERKGLTLRIDEPAYRPHSPTGIRFLHFLLAAPVIGLGIPIGLIFLSLMLNTRILSSSEILTGLGMPVLGEVPHMLSTEEIKKESTGLLISGLTIIGSLVIVMIIGILRIQGKT